MSSSMHHTYPVPSTTAPPPDASPKVARLIFHVGSASIMAYGFTGLLGENMGEFVRPQYGGFLQYLTILGLLASGITMLLSGASDMLPNLSAIKLLKRVFLLISLPVELVISSIYWGIILTVPHLMLPPAPDLASAPEPSSHGAEPDLFRIPLWMDLSMHALPAVSLLFDFFLLERKYPKPFSTYGAFALAAVFGSVYGVWVEHCAGINGAFPYPFLTIMPLEGRVATYAGATFGAWLVFRGLNGLHK
ncbi:hypothetical protein IAT38_000042 [Cryptococcus sp. DSM 104549]